MIVSASILDVKICERITDVQHAELQISLAMYVWVCVFVPAVYARMMVRRNMIAAQMWSWYL